MMNEAWRILPKWFSQLHHKVSSGGGKDYLASLEFAQRTTSAEVCELAEQLVGRINRRCESVRTAFSPCLLLRRQPATAWKGPPKGRHRHPGDATGPAANPARDGYAILTIRAFWQSG